MPLCTRVHEGSASVHVRCQNRLQQVRVEVTIAIFIKQTRERCKLCFGLCCFASSRLGCSSSSSSSARVGVVAVSEERGYHALVAVLARQTQRGAALSVWVSGGRLALGSQQRFHYGRVAASRR